MKKILIVLFAAVVITGCYNEPQSSTMEGHGFQVEFLFEKDSVKVYRFRDGGRIHYFTTMGETISTHSAGKSHYEENINNIRP